MKVIKETKTLKNYSEDIDEQAHAQGRESSYDVVKQMEKEWPQMTKEFKRLQHEQYVLFLHKQHDYLCWFAIDYS